jgi:hypothetical protein
VFLQCRGRTSKPSRFRGPAHQHFMIPHHHLTDESARERLSRHPEPIVALRASVRRHCPTTPTHVRGSRGSKSPRPYLRAAAARSDNRPSCSIGPMRESRDKGEQGQGTARWSERPNALLRSPLRSTRRSFHGLSLHCRRAFSGIENSWRMTGHGEGLTDHAPSPRTKSFFQRRTSPTPN